MHVGFKPDVVELVRVTGRPIAHLAAELGIDDSTLGAWVKQADANAWSHWTYSKLRPVSPDDDAQAAVLLLPTPRQRGL